LRPRAELTSAVETLEQIHGCSREEALERLRRMIDNPEPTIELPIDRKLYTVEDLQARKPFPVVPGPCSGESPENVMESARQLKEQGAFAFRAPLRKPRSRAEKHQGAGDIIVPAIDRARRTCDMLSFVEVADSRELITSRLCADVIWVGARFNPQFYRDVAKDPRPVGLKRAPGSTPEADIDLLSYFADRLDNVFIIERGIYTPRSTGTPHSRYTLDTTGIPPLRERIKEEYGIDIPIWVDPSHAAGQRCFVEPEALTAVGVADGFLVEFHPRPEEALSDAAQQLPTALFGEFRDRLFRAADALPSTPLVPRTPAR